MSLGSLPVIKNLVSRSRRERVPLTPEMISPPLGDFRHTMHVGRKGEVFGDTSFLTHCHEKHRHTRWNYITKKLRQARWMSPESQSLGHQVCPPPPISPIIKNAVSLPLLNKRNWDEETDGTPGMAWNSMSESYCHDGLESGFCTMPRLSSSEDPSEDTSFQKPDADWASSGLADTEESSVCTFSLEPSSSLCHSDSMQSLVMDFGPSLMTEILEGINFSDTPKKPEGTSVLHQESVLSTNNNPAKFEVTLDKSEAHQFQCDTQEFQCDTQEPKSLVSWEPTTIAEEMEIDTDSGITGSEQGSRGITGDLWDSGDGSEIEM